MGTGRIVGHAVQGYGGDMAAVVPQRRNDAALTAAVNERLDDDGYAIVEGVLPRDEAREIGDEIRRLLDGVPEGRNFFEGFKTRRLYAAFGKTRVLDRLATAPPGRAALA